MRHPLAVLLPWLLLSRVALCQLCETYTEVASTKCEASSEVLLVFDSSSSVADIHAEMGEFPRAAHLAHFHAVHTSPSVHC